MVDDAATKICMVLWLIPNVYKVTDQLWRGDGDVPDLAPSHDEHVVDLGRLPAVHPEGIVRPGEEAVALRMKGDAPETFVGDYVTSQQEVAIFFWTQ
jgi:hypothetical protein